MEPNGLWETEIGGVVENGYPGYPAVERAVDVDPIGPGLVTVGLGAALAGEIVVIVPVPGGLAADR